MAVISHDEIDHIAEGILRAYPGARPPDLRSRDTLEETKDSPTRIDPVTGHHQILFRGRWLFICRTDLKDDVGVFWSAVPDYPTYGARLSENAIRFIVALSDG